MNNESFFLAYHVLNSPLFLCATILFSIASKGYVIGKLIAPGIRAKYGQYALLFLLGALGCSFFGDFAWLVKIAQSFTHLFSYKLVIFSIRIAWAFLVFQYHFLSLFIYALLNKQFKLPALQKVLLVVSIFFVTYFLYLAFAHYHMFSTEQERDIARLGAFTPLLEFTLMDYILNYYNLAHVGLLLIHVAAKFKKHHIPNILRKQLSTFVLWLLCPYVITDILQGFLFDIEPIKSNIYVIVSISTLLLVFAILYCLQSVMHLRFLNRSYGIKSEVQLNFMYNFKAFLAQLSEIRGIQELGFIVQSFLSEEFGIPVSSTRVYLRNHNNPNEPYVHEEQKVERFVAARIQKQAPSLPLLVYDEIELHHFYQDNPEKQEMLGFLDDINAALFIPLYLHDSLVGYVIIDKEARPNGHFTEIECNGMLILASYLASITDLLRNRNKDSFIVKQKNMKEAFYRRHQEINLYRETIAYFMEQSNSNGIGVVFYRKNRFAFGNEAASHFIPFSIEQHPRDPLVKKLRKVVGQVQQYKSAYSLFSQDAKGRIVKICGMPQGDQQAVIITLSYPGIADIVSERLAVLQDHAKWDWLLYLQTTQAGNLVENYLPGNTPTLIAAKIKLLQAALGKHNLWLDTPHEDLATTAGLIHQISLRETIHTIELTEPEEDNKIYAALFGCQEGQKPLLEHLNNVGTLFIRNVHFLQKNTQEQLAQLMRYGFYTIHGTSRQQESDIRIICTSHQNLKSLARDDLIDTQLYNQLKANKQTLPSPALLAQDEFCVFVDGCVQQAVSQELFAQFLYLSEKDKLTLFRERIASFAVLKNRVFQILVHKTKESQLQEDQLFDPAYAINDPELIKAARLGKHALKDSKMMSMLLEKLQSQSKIAIFLGVNRSSVSRRCKAYGLE